MDDLFRFVILRPAKPVDPSRTVPVKASKQLADMIANTPSVEARLSKLTQFRNSVQLYGDLADYHYGTVMATFGGWAATAELSRDAAAKKVRDLTQTDAASLAESQEFASDITHLNEVLLVVKYLSDAKDIDIQMLSAARRGYDLVEQLAGEGQLLLRHLVSMIATFPANAQDEVVQRQPVAQIPADDLDAQLARLAEAQDALKNAMRIGFLTKKGVAVNHVPISETRLAAVSEARSALAGNETASNAMRHIASTTSRVGSPWQLAPEVLMEFSPAVLETLTRYAGDPRTTPATLLSLRLSDARASLLTLQAKQTSVRHTPVVRLGSTWYTPPMEIGKLSNERLPLPPGITQHNSIHPVGIGDLLIVREHVKAYEGGEVGHIENILRAEKMSRDTRRLEHVEQTTTVETETETEEERDTQSTDRFSLKRETNNTIKTDSQIKAGLNVDAKYGPYVEVKADLQGSYQHQTEDVTKQSTEFSKEVVSRSVSKLSTKVRQLQTTITLQEFEERYGHSFDNCASGSTNISGVYQFVDRVSEAQIYNYGKRLLFDVIVPEPAAFYIWAQQKHVAEMTDLECPEPLTITPADLWEDNYLIHAQKYGATSIDPAPPLYKTISQAWDWTSPSGEANYTKSSTVAIDDGYCAICASVTMDSIFTSERTTCNEVFVGNQVLNYDTTSVNLSGEEGTLGVGLFFTNCWELAVSLEILCERTDRAVKVWQEKAYAAIEQAYVQKLQDYQHALAELQTAQANAIGGRNPEANTAVINNELRKGCIEQLTTQHFDSFGAIGTDSSGQPLLNFSRLSTQSTYIRFFEEAFEWEHIVYSFYPYFWAKKDTWAQRSLLDDSDDPNFANFLRAGAARVVFPVRPGFEEAVIHYLETGLLWNGGDPPDISSSLYLPIVNEVAEARQQPEGEIPVGDPWDVRVPTQLVKLRNDDSLPRWKKNANGEWVPDDSA